MSQTAVRRAASSRVPPGAGGTAAPQPVPDRAQDAAMEGSYTALDGLGRGAAALTAENHQLRAQIAGLQPAVASRRSGDAAIPFGELAEIALPTGSGAPGAARKVIDHCFTGLVSQQILTDAELLVSELVTNSVEHGELGSDDTVLVRILLAAESLRVEVENPGTAGVVALDRSGSARLRPRARGQSRRPLGCEPRPQHQRLVRDGTCLNITPGDRALDGAIKRRRLSSSVESEVCLRAWARPRDHSRPPAYVGRSSRTRCPCSAA